MFQPKKRGDPQKKTFVDCGAAPGGMCHYLQEGLKWRGYAITLSREEEALR